MRYLSNTFSLTYVLDSVLKLEGWKVNVKIPSGEIRTLDVIPSWPIKDIKKM